MASSPSPLPEILVAGVGLAPVGEHWEKSLRSLALEAMNAAVEDAGGVRPQALFVGNMLAPALSGQTHLGVLLADFAGWRGIEAATYEAAGASGGVALRQAILGLASGAVDRALVVGVEKLTDRIGSSVEAALAAAADADFEAVQGVTPASQAALLMRRYIHEHRVPDHGFAGFCLNAHANAVGNPRAMYRKAIRLEDYVSAPMLSDPINLFDAAPVADGAAALLLTRAEAHDLPQRSPRVAVLGSAVATGPLALHDQPDPLGFETAALSARRALTQARASAEEIDLFELHDVFSIYAALSLEAAGFAERGQGWKLAAEGGISRDGRIPINTLGGSKARGDSGGATGIYQVAEVVLQLQGRAGECQVEGARIGMAHCLGGAGATAATHVLRSCD